MTIEHELDLESAISWILRNGHETSIEKLAEAIEGVTLVEGSILLDDSPWIADDGNQEIQYDSDVYDADEAAKQYVDDGDWGDDHRGSITVYTWQWAIDYKGNRCRVNESSHDIDLIATFDHAEAIKNVMGNAGCGTSPDDHDWTSEGEGGCDTNPGVWKLNGTTMVYKSHCRCCGLHRTETVLGWQRNPGEGDSVEYDVLDEETIEEYRKNGWMDEVSE